MGLRDYGLGGQGRMRTQPIGGGAVALPQDGMPSGIADLIGRLMPGGMPFSPGAGPGASPGFDPVEGMFDVSPSPLPPGGVAGLFGSLPGTAPAGFSMGDQQDPGGLGGRMYPGGSPTFNENSPGGQLGGMGVAPPQDFGMPALPNPLGVNGGGRRKPQPMSFADLGRGGPGRSNRF